jgi:hypothetical protein
MKQARLKGRSHTATAATMSSSTSTLSNGERNIRSSAVICLSVFLAMYYHRVAWLLYSTCVISHPSLLNDPFAEVYSQPSVATYGCDVRHEAISVVHDAKSFSDIDSAVSAQGLLAQRPILFKQYLDDPVDRMDRIKAIHADDSIIFTSVRLESFGNLWMNGIRPYGQVEMSLAEALSFTEKNLSASIFASFVSFMNQEAINVALKNPTTPIRVDTNFISNFERDVVSTRFHSATPIESYSVQLQGRKLWVFMDPDVSTDCCCFCSSRSNSSSSINSISSSSSNRSSSSNSSSSL